MTHAEKILAGNFGNTVKALTLSSLNWSACAALTKHPQLKAPVTRGFIEDTRDDVKLPEMEHIEQTQPLDVVVGQVVATYLLTEQMRRIEDTNERGQTIRPFAYLKPQTPSEAIRASFNWRADMAAKEIGAKARMLGLDAKAAETNARAQANGQNAEKLAYAMAEAASVTDKGMMTWDDDALFDLVLDMDVVGMALNASENARDRARARIQAGLWASIDAELLLFLENQGPAAILHAVA
jgi:hypothetical protein